MWREEEHEDSCSCSSHLYLESSSSTEIITVPAERVLLELDEVDRTFLMERLSLSAVGIENMLQYVQLDLHDGGAPGSRVVHWTDDIAYVSAPDTQDTAPDTDTDTAQVTDTDHTSDTQQAWDTDVAQTTDIQDTQDTQAKH